MNALAHPAAAAAWGQVQVLFQSDAVLQDPSDYWISVINAGRALKLNEVKPGYPPYPTAAVQAGAAAAAGDDGDNAGAAAVSEPAGCVVAALMHVGDMLGVGPATVAAARADAGPHRLALAYWASAHVAGRNGTRESKAQKSTLPLALHLSLQGMLVSKPCVPPSKSDLISSVEWTIPLSLKNESYIQRKLCEDY